MACSELLLAQYGALGGEGLGASQTRVHGVTADARLFDFELPPLVKSKPQTQPREARPAACLHHSDVSACLPQGDSLVGTELPSGFSVAARLSGPGQRAPNSLSPTRGSNDNVPDDAASFVLAIGTALRSCQA